MNSATKHTMQRMSFDKSPIRQEVQGIRDFYNKNCGSLYEQTPLNKKSIMKFIQTPLHSKMLFSQKKESMAKKNLGFSSIMDSGRKYTSPGHFCAQLSQGLLTSCKKSPERNRFLLEMAPFSNQNNFLINLAPADQIAD